MIDVTTHLQQAIAFHRAGDLSNAEKLYRTVLRLSPNHPNALCMLGMLAFQIGHVDTAIQYMAQAVAVAPAIVETHRQLGRVLMKAGRMQEAIQCYRQAIEHHSTAIDLRFHLGDLLRAQGDAKAAIDCYRNLLEQEPNCPEAHNNLGLAQVTERALESAVLSFLKAIELRPSFPEAHFNLSCVYREFGRYDLSVAAGREALRQQPGLGEALLANDLQHMCEWDELVAISKHLIRRVEENNTVNDRYPIQPFAFLGLHLETTAEQQWKCARQWATCKGLPTAVFQPNLPRAMPPAPGQRIRLGYLSADFQDHPVAYLTAELFEQHDRSRFEVFGYSLGVAEGGAMRRRIETAFDRFHDLRSCSPAEAARRIADDKIDILIDLQGYTRHARPEILAFRPASIQVNYLGYPGSMGTTCIDYILVDDFVVPLDQQPYFSERLVFLPGCFMVNDRHRKIASQTASRAELGLPDDGFVFCAFSSSYKITEEIFHAWLRALHSVPQSILWLRNNNPYANANLLRFADAAGIAAERIVFAPTVSMEEHLARHRAADVFLDTFPYNQHSTAADALRMGLPVITRAGQTFASRVTGSLLRAVDLDELTAGSLPEYEAIVGHLAQHPDELARIREKLAIKLRNSPLFDGKIFARNIEKAFQTMLVAT